MFSKHAHVREQRIVLKDGVDIAVVRRQLADVVSTEKHGTGRGQFESGDHSQHRGLAATRGAEQREELALVDFEVDVVDGDDIAVVLAQPDELDGRRETT